MLWRPPAQFLMDHVHVLPKGKVLDVAAGYGRNALFLAERGFFVHAVDRDQDALHTLLSVAREQQLPHVTVEVLDLETGENLEDAFPMDAYDAVIVFFYLFRPLFPALLRTLKPGGVLMYETFLVENYLRYHRPKHKDFCLEPGELRNLVQRLHILYYDEDAHSGTDGEQETFTARLLARKRPV